jgi:AcrR family transcriptional regulator
MSREEVLASQRGRIMRSVLIELGEKSAGGVTVSGVVHRAKVSKKTFYENFEGLNACIDEALRKVNVLVGSEIADAAEAADRTVPFSKVHALVSEIAAAATEEPEHGISILASGFGRADAKREGWLAFNTARMRILSAYFMSERERYPDLREPSETALIAALGLIETWIVRALAEHREADLPAEAAGVADAAVWIISGGQYGSLTGS